MKIAVYCAAALMWLQISSLHANEFLDGRDKNSVQAVQSLQAYAKYKMAQYDEARKIWLDLASKGNSSAFINLANLYEQGQGVERDLTQAFYWLQKAADSNDVRGLFQLAMAYEKGAGVERNLPQASYWLEQAAQQGDETAQFNLGVMLMTNYGKGLDTGSHEQRQQARKWLSLAEKNGVEEAKEFLNLLSSVTTLQQ